MRRVPVELILVMLAESGVQANAARIRNWTRRGHISRTRQGYDPGEVASYLERRGLVAHNLGESA
jgi:hypothetical protein